MTPPKRLLVTVDVTGLNLHWLIDYATRNPNKRGPLAQAAARLGQAIKEQHHD